MTDNKWVGEFRLHKADKFRAGTLRYDPIKGSELLISGSTVSENEYNDYPLISGVVEGHRSVALINCFDGGRTWNAAGFEHRTIFVNTIIFDIDKFSPDKRLFSAISIASSNINRWIRLEGLQDKYSRYDDFRLKWKRPKTIKAKIDGIRSIEINISYSQTVDFEKGEVKFNCMPSIRLLYSKRQFWDVIHWDMYSLEMFFVFVTRRWAGPSEIGLYSSQSRTKLEDHLIQKGKRKTYQKPHVVHISQDWYSDDEQDIRYDRGNLLFYSDSSSKIGKMIGNWFQNRQIIERALKLIYASQRKGIGIETSFLFLAQAAEYLHRESIGGQLIDEEQFEHLKKSLRDVISAKTGREDFNILSEKLNYLNEIGLRRRLKEIFRKIKNPPTYVKEYKILANKITNYRNTFTHHLSRKDFSDNWLQEVSCLCDILTSVIHLYLCRIIGFDDEDIDKVLGQEIIGRLSQNIVP